MKYFLDTEFIERPCTIDLISVGIVAEDGREFYAVNSECNLDHASEWVINNVLSSMGCYDGRVNAWKGIALGSPWFGVDKDIDGIPHLFAPRKMIASQLLDFINSDPPEFWGYYADYDWVVFCWIFGPMVKLPKGWPMYCRDVKQEADRFGVDKIPIPDNGHHNALEDARWTKLAYDFLTSNAPARPVPPLRSAVQNAEKAAKTAANTASAK